MLQARYTLQRVLPESHNMQRSTLRLNEKMFSIGVQGRYTHPSKSSIHADLRDLIAIKEDQALTNR
jgi:hypothetical protein